MAKIVVIEDDVSFLDLLRVHLASAGHEADVRRLAEASSAENTVRRIQAVMTCRERLELNVAPLLAVEEMTLALATR